MNWIGQYFFGKPHQPRWTSILIMFYDEDQLVLDKGYVFLGKAPKDYLGYYCNLSNFTVIDKRLFYFYKDGRVKRIDPEKVLIHMKFGKGNFEAYHWSTFFSSYRNDMINIVKGDINPDKIKIIDTERNTSKHLKASNAEHPLFKKKQIYGQQMDQVILSGLNINYF